ncbi:MurR/RpiR family transcriptional regulator [Sneathiella glossodoripedis]|uniref:MurR/RpiR family transcriptional regulator n=1 Tax=Sneathiella glossodoripedis TaxID=418853 RepID=UPI00131EED17|nr:MurR/RpiR family transcriptional regulator [Sneathiella glossodoripedis]
MNDVLDLVERNYNELSPQLQLAARYMLSSPDEVALYSMRHVAERASVKPATMLRLANRLGFETYNDFRQGFRERISEPSSGYAARARKLQMRQSDASRSSLVKELADAELDNVQRTFSEISDADIFSSADSFIRANNVHVIGLRKCASVAGFFKYATRVFFPQAQLISGNAGLFSEEIHRINSGDILLAIAFDPYTSETVAAARHASKVGATLVVITDSSVSPLNVAADHLFVVANRSPSFYRSLLGAMAIAQALVAAIVTHLGDEGVAALEKSDQTLRNTQTYWQG